jgi:hypothetical protein
VTDSLNVEVGKPFETDPEGLPTLRVEIPTSPGFSVRATISQEAARGLIEQLRARLDDITRRKYWSVERMIPFGPAKGIWHLLDVRDNERDGRELMRRQHSRNPYAAYQLLHEGEVVDTQAYHVQEELDLSGK